LQQTQEDQNLSEEQLRKLEVETQTTIVDGDISEMDYRIDVEGLEKLREQLKQREADLAIVMAGIDVDEEHIRQSGIDTDISKERLRKEQVAIDIAEEDVTQAELELKGTQLDTELTKAEVRYQQTIMKGNEIIQQADEIMLRVSEKDFDISEVSVRISETNAEIAKIGAQIAKLEAEEGERGLLEANREIQDLQNAQVFSRRDLVTAETDAVDTENIAIEGIITTEETLTQTLLDNEDSAHELRMNAMDDQDSQHTIMSNMKKAQAELAEGRADTEAEDRKSLADTKRTIIETNYVNIADNVSEAIAAAEEIANADISNKLTHTIGTA